MQFHRDNLDHSTFLQDQILKPYIEVDFAATLATITTTLEAAFFKAAKAQTFPQTRRKKL